MIFKNTLAIGILLSCFQVVFLKDQVNQPYDPDWESLDKRPMPEWFDDAKIGFFTHYGLYSVPSFQTEWFLYHFHNKEKNFVNFVKKYYGENFEYKDFVKFFKAEFFSAKEYAGLIKSFGVKYFIVTTKHHEGFCMWDSPTAKDWNSVDVGPKINFIEQLTQEVRKLGIRVVLYYSFLEWYHPLFLEDKANHFKTHRYVDEIMMPQIKDLVIKYQPDGIWCDGDGEADSKYWRSADFLAWLFSNTTVKDEVVVNDRWGTDITCKHGTFRNCKDRFLPSEMPDFKWENVFTLDKYSWGNRREIRFEHVLEIGEILFTVIKTIALGGNVGINAGTAEEGTIPLIYQYRLKQLGRWLNINGEGIFKTRPFLIHSQSNDTIWFTESKETNDVFAFFFIYPLSRVITLDLPPLQSTHIEVELLGNSDPLDIERDKSQISVHLPDFAEVQSFVAYTLKIKRMG